MFDFIKKWFGKEPKQPAVIVSPDQAGMASEAQKDGSKLCPVCGQYTFTEPHEICPVCGWEQDRVQEEDPDFAGGANQLSLNQAIAAFKAGEGVR